jgi:DNA-binding CsgD family transcriptional regulator
MSTSGSLRIAASRNPAALAGWTPTYRLATTTSDMCGAIVSSMGSLEGLLLAPRVVGGGAIRIGDELRRALSGALAGHDVPDGVRPEIGASWRRSTAAGLDPGHFEVPFDPLSEDHGPLREAAAPVLDQLVTDVGDARVAFILTNQRGQVLDRRVSAGSLASRLDAILLAEGFVYGEEAVGTNGIGTALANRGGTVVNGHEHFADALTRFVCAASPIVDPISRQTVGAIDLTCIADEGSALMLPFARRAARDIEQRLLDSAGVADRIVLQRFLQERKRAKGPIVVVTPRSMITNAAADRLLRDGDEASLREWARLHASAPALGPATVMLTNGTAVTVHAETVLDGASPVGTVLRLRVASTGSRTRSLDRTTFGWESLTPTEHSVTDLVAEGLTNQQIAERLFLSRHTVGFHLRSIFRKLSVNSRVDLTRLVVQRADWEPMSYAGA